MKKSDIVKLTSCTVKDAAYPFISVTVFAVQKCNFNDEYLLEQRWLTVEELKDRPLEWFDLYLGKNPKGEKRVALALVEGKQICLLEKKGEEIEVIRYNASGTYYDTDELNERCFLAVHMDARTAKW